MPSTGTSARALAVPLGRSEPEGAPDVFFADLGTEQTDREEIANLFRSHDGTLSIRGDFATELRARGRTGDGLTGYGYRCPSSSGPGADAGPPPTSPP